MLRMRCLWTACVLLLAAVPSWGATLVVANKSDDTVDLVALDTGRSVATLPTGHAPHVRGTR